MATLVSLLKVLIKSVILFGIRLVGVNHKLRFGELTFVHLTPHLSIWCAQLDLFGCEVGEQTTTWRQFQGACPLCADHDHIILIDTDEPHKDLLLFGKA